MEMENRDRAQEQEVKADDREAKAAEKDSGTHGKFTEPRGWALKWDGVALAKAGDKETSR
jgi:hypothetical protein